MTRSVRAGRRLERLLLPCALVFVGLALGAIALRAPEVVRALSPSPVECYGIAVNGSATGAASLFKPVNVATVDSAAAPTNHAALGAPSGAPFVHFGLAFAEERGSLGMGTVAATVSSSSGTPVTIATAGTSLQRVYVLTLIVGNTDTQTHHLDLIDSITGLNIMPRVPVPVGGFILDGRGDIFTSPGAAVQFRIDAGGSGTSCFAGATVIRTTQ